MVKAHVCPEFTQAQARVVLYALSDAIERDDVGFRERQVGINAIERLEKAIKESEHNG